MKSFTARLMIALTVLGMGGDAALADGVIAPGAELQTLSKDFAFSEGPASEAFRADLVSRPLHGVHPGVTVASDGSKVADVRLHWSVGGGARRLLEGPW